MTVLFFGSGYPMPSFIQTRLECLRAEGIVVKLVLPFHLANHSCGFPVISAGGKLSYIDLVRVLAFLLVRPMGFMQLIWCRPDLDLPQRFKWGLKHLFLTNLRGSYIFHFQWLTFAAEFGWLKKLYPHPFVTSVRGSQLTIYPMTRPGYQGIIMNALMVSDLIHCVSKDLALRCLNLGVEESRIIVNYNGVNTLSFKPAQRNRTGVFGLVSVGSLIWRKGYLFQLLVVKRLLQFGEVKLNIVGRGPDFEALQYWVDLLELRNNVKFYGSVSPTEIAEVLVKADCYISTSAAEGLANSVLEAAACGLPVIAFDCDGMHEIIKDGETGFVVPFGNLDKMVEKAVRLLKSPEMAYNFGLSARAHIEKNFDQQIWVKHMVNIYQSL